LWKKEEEKGEIRLFQKRRDKLREEGRRKPQENGDKGILGTIPVLAKKSSRNVVSTVHFVRNTV
jgi:hypothetical protein